jgi:hypothetical protein
LKDSLKDQLKSVRFLKSKKIWKLLFRSWLSMCINFIAKNQTPCSCYQLDTKPSPKELPRSRRETGMMTSKLFHCTLAGKDSKKTLLWQEITIKGLLSHHRTSTKSALPPNPKTKTSINLLLTDNRNNRPPE